MGLSAEKGLSTEGNEATIKLSSDQEKERLARWLRNGEQWLPSDASRHHESLSGGHEATLLTELPHDH